MKKKLTKELIYSLNSNDIHKKHPLGFKKLFIYYYEDINKIEDIALIESLVDKSLNISEKFKDDYMENHFKKSIGFISFSKDLYQYQEEYFPFIAGDYFRIKKEILYLKATSNNDTKKLVEIYSKIDNYFKENFTNIADYNEYYNIKKRYISSEN